MGLKQKHIESFLQEMQGFDFNEKEKWGLEQHMTPPNFAAQMIYEIYQREELLEESVVGDLGCGTGMLSAGLLYAGAMQTIGFEIDQKYIERTREQLTELFEEDVQFDLVNINIKDLNNKSKSKLLDLVVMNPPFGTKDEGIDLVFLEKARENCRGNIYSLHKTTTRDFLKKTAEKWGYEFEVIKTFKFPLPKRFTKYHKKDMAYTEVDFIVLQVTQEMEDQFALQEQELLDNIQQNSNIEQYLEFLKFKEGQDILNYKQEDNDEEEEDDEDEDEEEEDEEDQDEEEDQNEGLQQQQYQQQQQDTKQEKEEEEQKKEIN